MGSRGLATIRMTNWKASLLSKQFSCMHYRNAHVSGQDTISSSLSSEASLPVSMDGNEPSLSLLAASSSADECCRLFSGWTFACAPIFINGGYPARLWITKTAMQHCFPAMSILASNIAD